MAKTHNNKRLRWTDQELDNFYRAAIIERRSADYLMSHSSNGRTWAAINTKMWKEFGIVQRTNEDGETHMYLSSEVPNKIVRRRQAVETDYVDAGMDSIEYPLDATSLEFRLRAIKTLQEAIQQATDNIVKLEESIARSIS